MELLQCIVVELTNDINQGRWPSDQHDFNNQEVISELQDRIQGYQYQDYLAASNLIDQKQRLHSF